MVNKKYEFAESMERDWRMMTYDEVLGKAFEVCGTSKESGEKLGEEIINARIVRYEKKKETAVIYAIADALWSLASLAFVALNTNVSEQVVGGIWYLITGSYAVSYLKCAGLYDEAIKAIEDKKEAMLERAKRNRF